MLDIIITQVLSILFVQATTPTDTLLLLFTMSLASSAAKATLQRKNALLQATLGVLGQKLDLMASLKENLGHEKANQGFSETCPVVGASVGQHFRHSMDHMERVATILNDRQELDHLHYDVRIRGGNDEHDMDAAKERIQRVSTLFRNEIDKVLVGNEESSTSNIPVMACFFLSGDSDDEFLLPSTLERELGFVAHHAIHHLAMVKIIAIDTLRLLPPDGLPDGFGKAPSTIVYDNQQKT